MAKLLKIGRILAFSCAVLVYPAVWIVSTQAVEVYMITAHAPEVVAMNEATFISNADPKSEEYKKEVVQTYGSCPDMKPEKVVFVSPSRLIKPKKLPELTLLPMDFKKEASPLQLRSFYFMAPFVLAGALAAGIVLLVLGKFFRPKSAAAPAAPPAA